ncbi:spore coat U domain-containing protein (plasmid) [Serratia nevei]|uniref:Csu type fimbrial protein n=1 Tax=Serratia nevei TaxID=2703794 RepID=UPI003F6B4FED
MKVMMKYAPLAAVVGVLAGVLMAPAQADTDTQSFKVKLTVTSTCDIHTTAATDVDFGSHTSTEGAVTADGALSVNCTNGTAYQIGLDNGENYAGGSRNMKNTSGSETVAYTLWKDAGRAQPWGNTLDNDTLAGTGSGVAQVIPVYGKVELSTQNLKAASYEDKVTATVTY